MSNVESISSTAKSKFLNSIEIDSKHFKDSKARAEARL